MIKMENKIEHLSSHAIYQRRYFIAFLFFLSLVVSQSQRLNLSFALVDMVNVTEHHSNGLNTTECPDLRNDTGTKNENAEFSWDAELQGLIISSQYIGYCIAQFPGGLLCELLGVKKMILINIIIGSLCNLLSPIAARTDPYLLFVAHLIKGVGQGLPLAAQALLSARWFPKPEKGFLSAFVLSGYPLGAFLGSAISGPVCALELDGGWPLVFYIFGFFGIFISIFIMIFYVEKPTDDPNISDNELKYILENINSMDTVKRPPTPWGEIMASVSTYSLILALFGQNWMSFYFLSVHPLYMDTILKIPIKENGLLTSGPHFAQLVAGVTVCLFSYWINKNDTSKINIARKGCNSFAVILFVFGLGGIYLSGCDILWNEFFLILSTASAGFTFGGCLIVAVDMTPTYCGPLFGLVSTIASLSGFIIPILSGKLTKDEQTMAQWHKMFLITVVVVTLNGVVFLLWGSTKIQSYDPAYQKEKASKHEMNEAEITSTLL
ncbi:putative inorganic phosphate cotransporter isoform X2 [Parasteatoda tepidariorum]|uniref:putative inorganic phosphate cotransporter isoform X2 n=1 Tax=Parasteatoda tepidariorum TaxID=114398 RepID=UPI00077F9360|nr:putative inorganic phosphate cotransporter [Parasteatoda tepidariorum]